MKSQNTEKRSSDDVKHEVHQELRNVRKDIDKLQRRLSPGQIIDDAIFYPHGRSVGATFNHLKNNPIGTALLSLGTLLLMEDENHMTYETSARSKVSSLKESVKNQMPHKELQAGQVPNAMDRARSKLSGFKDDLQTKTSELKHNLQEKKEDLRHKFQDKSVELKDKIGDAQSHLSMGADFEGVNNQISSSQSRTDKLKENLSGSYDKARTKNSSGLQASKEKVQNLDPMSYIALGAGLGALTGASIPVSDAEKNMIDTRFTDSFSSFSRELQDAVNQSANILKDLVIDDVKGFSADVFNRS